MKAANYYDFEHVRARITGNGFVTMTGVFSEAELAEIEVALDDFVLGGFSSALSFLGRGNASVGLSSGEQRERKHIAWWSRAARRSAVLQKCRAIASSLLGKTARYQFDHAIYKGPSGSPGTPWHQDQAYLGEQVWFDSVHFWIPLQDTSARNGALQFAVPQPADLLPHGPAGAEFPGLLKVSGDPPEVYETVHLRRGDLSVHTNLALHAAHDNVTAASRKAWVIHFAAQSLVRKYYRQAMQRF